MKNKKNQILSGVTIIVLILSILMGASIGAVDNNISSSNSIKAIETADKSYLDITDQSEVKEIYQGDTFHDSNLEIVEYGDYKSVVLKSFPPLTKEDQLMLNENPTPFGDVLSLPSSFSWKDCNGDDWTTPAKSQGAVCGSCWDFAALGAFEAAINIVWNNPNIDKDLSEQYVLSCLSAAGSCNGGYAWKAINCIQSSDPGPSGNGINGCTIESCMPYQEVDYIPCDDKCPEWNYTTDPPRLNNKLFQIVDWDSTNKLKCDNPDHWDIIKSWIFEKGPLAVGLLTRSYWHNLSDWGWIHHSPDDVYQGYDYQGAHVVLVVGWVDDPNILNGGYWICKNSWGTSWGYDGFFNIAYGCSRFGELETTWVTAESPDNVPPILNFSVNPSIAIVGDTITFNSSSKDVDGDIVNTTWDFGDGSKSYDVNTTHVYTQHGFYYVTITLTDNDNAKTTETVIVWIVNAMVDDDYEEDEPEIHKWNSLQEGIDDVTNGDWIYVYNGIYRENVIVDKSVFMYGENRDSVIVQGESIGITILNAELYLNGFTVEGSRDIGIYSSAENSNKGNNVFENCQIIGNNVGFKFDNTANNTIYRCNISSNNIGIEITDNSQENGIRVCELWNNHIGISIKDSIKNWIGSPPTGPLTGAFCNFALNDIAIYLENADETHIHRCYIDATQPQDPHTDPTNGILIEETVKVTIHECVVLNASGYGIYSQYSNENMIDCCAIYQNDKGIFLENSSEYIVKNCSLLSNSEWAVAILGESVLNQIYFNNFIENGGPLSGHQAYDEGSENKWYYRSMSQADCKGNYWSDYQGQDNNGDGIGDTPYRIIGPARSYDRYPVMEHFEWEF